MTHEEYDDGPCRTCGEWRFPTVLTSDDLCIYCCEKERDALLRANEEARTLNLELVRVCKKMLENIETNFCRKSTHVEGVENWTSTFAQQAAIAGRSAIAKAEAQR